MELTRQSLTLLEHCLALGLLVQSGVLQGAADLLGKGHCQLAMPLGVVAGPRMDNTQRSGDRSSYDNRQPQQSSSVADRFEARRQRHSGSGKHQGCVLAPILDDDWSRTGHRLADERGCRG